MKGKLDKKDLVSAISSLGLHPTSYLMVHASLSSLGFMVDGAAGVVAALREVAGPDGAVVMPSFRDAIRSDYYSLNECKDCCPQGLCPSREPGFTGIIGETLREQSDAVRSCHPTHSWVGIGEGAKFMLDGHCHSPTPCGKDSPFFRLMERDGAVVLLGVGINCLTNIHAVEDVRNVPYLSAFDPPRRHATYTTSGRRIQYDYPELLHAVLRETGLLQSCKIGAAICHVISARALGAFLWIVTQDDLWCLALRPRGDIYEPFRDACEKSVRMVHAWGIAANPQSWKELLAQSSRQTDPIQFHPATSPEARCPAYRGMARGYHRCAANAIPPWEKFEDYPITEPGVATCDHCNWPGPGIEGDE